MVTLRRVAAALVAMAALSACGSSAANKPAAAQGTVVQAALTEYKIALSPMPTTAGTYTFVATNRGAAVHALAVQGPGGSQRTSDLGVGKSAEFTVTIASGTTDVFCPVGSHKELGMDVQLTVP